MLTEVGFIGHRLDHPHPATLKAWLMFLSSGLVAAGHVYGPAALAGVAAGFVPRGFLRHVEELAGPRQR